MTHAPASATSSSSAFSEELLLRTIADRHLEVSWNYSIEFHPSKAHFCKRPPWERTDTTPILCHSGIFDPHVADILQSTSASSVRFSLNGGVWRPEWGMSPVFERGWAAPDGGHVEAEFPLSSKVPVGGQCGNVWSRGGMTPLSGAWIGVRRRLGGLLGASLAPSAPYASIIHHAPELIAPNKEHRKDIPEDAPQCSVRFRLDAPRERPGLNNIRPWGQLMPCGLGFGRTTSTHFRKSGSQDDLVLRGQTRLDEEYHGIGNLLQPHVFFGDAALFSALHMRAAASWECRSWRHRDRCKLTLETVMTTILSDVVVDYEHGKSKDIEKSPKKGFSLASLLSGKLEPFKGEEVYQHSIRNHNFNDWTSRSTKNRPMAKDEVSIDILGKINACPLANRSVVRTRLPAIIKIGGTQDKERALTWRNNSFATKPNLQRKKSLESWHFGSRTLINLTRYSAELVEFDEVEHPLYAVASVYGPRHTVNLTMNSSPDIPSYLRQWVSIETNSSTILNPIAPPSETTTSWFDQTPLAVNKRLLPMAAWRGGMLIDVTLQPEAISFDLWPDKIKLFSSSRFDRYLRFLEPIPESIITPFVHTLRVHVINNDCGAYKDSRTGTAKPKSSTFGLRDLPHKIHRTNSDIEIESYVHQHASMIIDILLPLEKIMLDMQSSCPPRVQLAYDFSPNLIEMELWPPEIARGFELPTSEVRLIASQNISAEFQTNEWPVHHSQLLSQSFFSPGILLVPPLLDFSMPFNVISLNSTLWAGLLGMIFNILTKPVHRQNKTKKRKPRKDNKTFKTVEEVKEEPQVRTQQKERDDAAQNENGEAKVDAL